MGDPDQCFPTGTKIQTPSGQKKIKDLKKGDDVLAASGRGATMASRVSHVGKRAFKGNLIKAVTRAGHIIKATPNHIVFSRLGMNRWEHFFDAYRLKTPLSKNLFKRAKGVMPGGISHNIHYFPPYPFFVKNGKASKIWDVRWK